VSGIDNVKVIEVGAGYYLALKSDRTVWTWKSHISAGTKTNVILNSDSVPQLIKEVNPLWAVPTQLTGLTNIIAVAAGRAEYNLSLKSDGTVWAWALNHYNQIENNTSEISNKILPIKIEGLTDIVAITSVRSGYMGYTLFQVHR
jgi:alpha-tubulin suppressor-like RCC1 family protein